MLHLMAHALRMKHLGLKSERQVEDVRRHLINSALANMPPGEYDHLKRSGMLDQLQAAAGGDDEEDPADATRRQHGETVRALVHFLGCSAGSGHCSHEQALEQIKPHFGDLPKGVSARELIGEMMSRIHAGKPLHDGADDAEQRREVEAYVARKYGSSDAEPEPGREVDSYIAKRYGHRGRHRHEPPMTKG
jgi:hypothetical protein